MIKTIILELFAGTRSVSKAFEKRGHKTLNPRGALRNMDFMSSLTRYTVTYCQYGDKRMKPTDIWTNHPNPQFKEPCKNGDKCHEPAPRGSRTGTQGIKGAIQRAIIPNELCEHIVDICEEKNNKKEM